MLPVFFLLQGFFGATLQLLPLGAPFRSSRSRLAWSRRELGLIYVTSLIIYILTALCNSFTTFFLPYVLAVPALCLVDCQTT